MSNMCADRQRETPTRLSVSDAAKAAGIGRSTINKHIAEGKISKGKDESGRVYVDVSELVRAYPTMDMNRLSETVSEIVSDGQHETLEKATLDTDLQLEVVALRERLEAANQRLERETKLLLETVDDLRRRLDAEAEERRRLTMMLTDQRPKQPEAMPAPPQEAQESRLTRAWRILTGKG